MPWTSRSIMTQMRFGLQTAQSVALALVRLPNSQSYGLNRLALSPYRAKDRRSSIGF